MDPTSDTSSSNHRSTLRDGRYQLRQKLGQGSMGSVYLAEDLLLPGRLVAIKQNSDSSADAQAQFKREALLLARLRHPNLPQVMDYFIEADGKQYLVMDYVPGDNLLELMRKRQGPLPAAEAFAIVEQVMQALAYMHAWRDPDSGSARPIIHRDIKPANIKRTPEGRVVLVDFGIAKVDSGTLTGTAVSAKALTPGYAPLEQYGGGTDARSDIYALGATLYALLTGKAPPSATDMAMAADKQRAPLLTGLKGAPPAAAKVIERAMQSLPKDRYQSIAEMYQALHSRPLPATGIVNQTPPTRQGIAGNRQLSWLVGALGVLLAIGMGWLLFAQSSNRPGAPVALLPTPSAITPTVPPATTPAALATSGQSALAAEPVTPTLTPTPSDAATPAPAETPAEAPVATASATFIPSATATSTLPPTLTPTPRPTATRTPTTRPTATVDATATAVELEVQRRLAATQTALAPSKTPRATRTPLPTATPTLNVTATAIELDLQRRLAATQTAQAVSTDIATSTPMATSTPRPTATPFPTSTAVRTPTLPATSTTQPTATMTRTPLPTPTALPTPTLAPVLTRTPTPAAPTVTVLQNANIRSGPGTNYAVIGAARVGDQFVVTGRNSDGSWWEILQSGETGWISGSLVSVASPNLVRIASVIPTTPTPWPAPPTASLQSAASTSLPPTDATVAALTTMLAQVRASQTAMAGR